MPHSLRAKIKGLRYKGIITDKDCDRICKALDNENVLDKIRAEIEFEVDHRTNMLCAEDVFQIIDRYGNEVSE